MGSANIRLSRCRWGRLGIQVLTIGIILIATTAHAFPTSGGGHRVDWLSMSLALVGGLALFLLGMEMMTAALKAVAGNRMRDVLGRLTKNSVKGLLTGTFVTAVIQSSSVTTVMLVGFVTAGLMPLTQAIGVIFGANIGTTVTAQIIAFNISEFSLLFIALGFAMAFVNQHQALRQYGSLILGLGLVFFGLGIMSDGMAPLRTFTPFIDFMETVSNPLLGIGIAALFTALIQSSSAATGVVIALASQGFISLETGIAMILGANIGTCVTAGLAAIGKPREAIRVALAHVFFNTGGVILVLAFIPELATLVKLISPAHSELDGISRLAAETPRQIANAHTVFNVVISFFFLPFASLLAAFCEYVLPDRPAMTGRQTPPLANPRYLDDSLISTPALALRRVQLEIGCLGEQAAAMYKEILDATLSRDRERLLKIREMDETIDTLHEAIIQYLRKIGVGHLSENQGRLFVGLMEIANNVENIGDVIETDLVTAGIRAIDRNIVISDSTRKILIRFHEEVGKSLDLALHAISSQDELAAQTVMEMKPHIQGLAEAAALHGAQRLIVDEPNNRAQIYSREMEMIEKYKRIYYFTKRVAKAVLTVPKAQVSETTAPREGAAPTT